MYNNIGNWNGSGVHYTEYAQIRLYLREGVLKTKWAKVQRRLKDSLPLGWVVRVRADKHDNTRFDSFLFYCQEFENINHMTPAWMTEFETKLQLLK